MKTWHSEFHMMIKREHLCFQYRLCPLLASLTATQCLLMDLSTFVNTAWGRRLHCSTRARSRSPNVWGGLTCWRRRRPSSSQICSIGLRSGLRDGQSKTFNTLNNKGRTSLSKKTSPYHEDGAHGWCPLVVVQGNFTHKCSLLIILWILFWRYPDYFNFYQYNNLPVRIFSYFYEYPDVLWS